MKSSELSKESLYALAVVSDILLKEKSWIVSQYMLELILAFVTRVASCKINDGGDLYIQLTRVCSSILLFHRHRINGRYHLVLRAFINLSSCLTSESPWLFNNEQSLSLAYARLVSNLCEPPIQSIREKGGKSNLTSSSALAKQTLGKFLPILLVNYINASLNQGFTSQVSETLKPALYNIFEVLGTEGVKTTSSLVDSSARAFLKIIYDNYMTNGKWQG